MSTNQKNITQLLKIDTLRKPELRLPPNIIDNDLINKL
jgi:hypothetical protein